MKSMSFKGILLAAALSLASLASSAGVHVTVKNSTDTVPNPGGSVQPIYYRLTAGLMTDSPILLPPGQSKVVEVDGTHPLFITSPNIVYEYYDQWVQVKRNADAIGQPLWLMTDSDIGPSTMIGTLADDTAFHGLYFHASNGESDTVLRIGTPATAKVTVKNTSNAVPSTGSSVYVSGQRAGGTAVTIPPGQSYTYTADDNTSVLIGHPSDVTDGSFKYVSMSVAGLAPGYQAWMSVKNDDGTVTKSNATSCTAAAPCTVLLPSLGSASVSFSLIAPDLIPY